MRHVLRLVLAEKGVISFSPETAVCNTALHRQEGATGLQECMQPAAMKKYKQADMMDDT